MRFSSVFRIAALALSLTAATGAIGSAFAANENVAYLPPGQQASSNTGPYDGAAAQAAQQAYK